MAGAQVSFVVLAGRATVIVDVPGAGHDGPLTAEGDPVVWSFTRRGLRLLPGFLGLPMPEAADLVGVAAAGHFAVATTEDVDVLRVGLEDLPEGWVAAAEDHAGLLLFVGRDLELTGLDDERRIGTGLDAAAMQGRVLGAGLALGAP